jgi:hypothetical protein
MILVGRHFHNRARNGIFEVVNRSRVRLLAVLAGIAAILLLAYVRVQKPMSDQSECPVSEETETVDVNARDEYGQPLYTYHTDDFEPGSRSAAGLAECASS